MSTRPPRSAFESQQIVSFSGWETTCDILGTLRQLENGLFRNAAILADQFGRDDRIDGVLRTRVDELLQSQLDITPVDDRAKAKRIAEMLGGAEDGPGEWDRMFPQGTLSKIHRTGLCLNFAFAKINWLNERDMWWPRLDYWNTQFVRFDWWRRCFVVMTMNAGEVELPRLDQNPIGDGQWFVWCPFGYQEAWFGGLVRSLAQMYLRRMWTNRDWSRFGEAHGLPMHKAIVPGDAKPEETNPFFEAVLERQTESTVLCPQGAEGKKYDVEILEAAARTWETFKDQKSDVNTDIAVLVLGQNLTTESPGGHLSNGGAQQGPRAVLLNKARMDASLATALRDQVLVPWARFNFGDPDLAPRPIYRVDPPEDEGKKAATMKAVGDGVTSLKAAGIAVDERKTGEEFGIVMLTPEQEAARKAEQEKKLADAAAAQPPANDNQEPKPGDQKQPEGSAALSAKVSKLARRKAFAARTDITRREYAGLPIAIEHRAGSTRTWEDADGQTGSTLMRHDYGFVEGHMGADGEELDVYLGPNESAPDVHIVHQLELTAEAKKRLSDRRSSNAELASNGSEGQSAVKQFSGDRSVEAQFPGRGLSGLPAALQAQAHAAIRDVEALGDRSDGGARGTHGQGRAEIPESRAAVLSSVVALLHHREIRRIIVQAVPVEVVDDLVAGKLPAEMPLHDHPVLKALAAAVVNKAVHGAAAQGSDVAASSSHEDQGYPSSSDLKYSEDKIMMGFDSADAARHAYCAHYPAWMLGSMSIVPIEKFKAKLKRRAAGGMIHARAKLT